MPLSQARIPQWPWFDRQANKWFSAFYHKMQNLFKPVSASIKRRARCGWWIAASTTTSTRRRRRRRRPRRRRRCPERMTRRPPEITKRWPSNHSRRSSVLRFSGLTFGSASRDQYPWPWLPEEPWSSGQSGCLWSKKQEDLGSIPAQTKCFFSLVGYKEVGIKWIQTWWVACSCVSM